MCESNKRLQGKSFSQYPITKKNRHVSNLGKMWQTVKSPNIIKPLTFINGYERQAVGTSMFILFIWWHESAVWASVSESYVLALILYGDFI